jgi:hypothetical protein
MAITPTNSLLSALSNIGANTGTDGIRPRPVQPVQAPAAPQQAKPSVTNALPAAPDPARPLPRGSIVNLVI